MEHISSTNVVTIRNGKNKMFNDRGLPKSKKKMGGVMHFVKVALYMLRRKSSKSKASMQVGVSSNGPWTEVLASMRPLHAGSSQCLPPSDEMPMAVPMIETFEDVLIPPLSPAPTMTLASPSESDYGMSQYASAQDLQELDTATTADDNEEKNDNAGDEMIDVKAEEFIAQFYEQMRIQNVQYMNTHNRRTS